MCVLVVPPQNKWGVNIIITYMRTISEFLFFRATRVVWAAPHACI